LIVIDGMHEGGSPQALKNHLSHAESDVYTFWLFSACSPQSSRPSMQAQQLMFSFK
jgi:hypothetical protein